MSYFEFKDGVIESNKQQKAGSFTGKWKNRQKKSIPRFNICNVKQGKYLSKKKYTKHMDAIFEEVLQQEARNNASYKRFWA